MGAYDNLAENLRLLCKKHGSISQVCREIGINRQQFTKYLNGDNIPRRHTLEQICEYFKVRDVDLFVAPDQQILEGDETYYPILHTKAFRTFVKQLGDKSENPLDDGFYMTYFRSKRNPDWVVRSITAVKTNDGISEFYRLTGYGEKKRSAWGLYRGRHHGVILNHKNIIYLLGFNHSLSKEPTMIVAQWSSAIDNILQGMAIIKTISGVEPCMVIIERLSSSDSLREAIRGSGAIGFKEQGLPDRIRHAYNNFDSTQI